MSNGNMRIFGTWPYVDVHLTRDYAQADSDIKGQNKTPQVYVTIHMDIPIDEAGTGDIDKCLGNCDGQGAYDAIMHHHQTTRSASQQKDAEAKASATLKAALGAK